MTTRVWLVRHAETARPDVFHGAESDVLLSARGQRQATALAVVFAELQPDLIVCSAMRRAVATAWPIAEACRRPLRVEPRLHERAVGPLSGTPNRPTDGIWPDTLRRWMAGETSYTPPESESFDDVRDRVLPVWRRLTEDLYPGRRLVIVAHGLVCKVVQLSLVNGYSPADWLAVGPIRNAAVTEFVPTAEGWRTVRLNEVPAPAQLDDG
jgi:probable phosphoglycerate mutase